MQTLNRIKEAVRAELQDAKLPEGKAQRRELGNVL
jgi:hypothetical protein